MDEEHLDKLEQKLGEKLTDFLEDVISEYYGLTAHQLETLTHSEEPWIAARMGLSVSAASNNPIKNKDMMEYYKKFAENSKSL